MEGAPLQEPEIIAKQIILQLNNFPIYLLAASNKMIGKIVSNAFDVPLLHVFQYSGYMSFNELKQYSRICYPPVDMQSDTIWC